MHGHMIVKLAAACFDLTVVVRELAPMLLKLTEMRVEQRLCIQK
jgi:hypothetical protein